MLPVVQAVLCVAACIVACWIAVLVVLSVRTPVSADDGLADDRDPCGPGLLHVATGPRLSRDVPTLPVDITLAPSQVAALAEPFPHPEAESPLFFTL